MFLLKILIILKEYWLIDFFKALSGQSDLQGILKFIEFYIESSGIFK